MDVSLNTTTTAARHQSANTQALRANRADPAQERQTPSTPTADTRSGSTADTSATTGLQELTRDETAKLHEALLAELRADVRSGAYEARMEVVADRVLDAIDALDP